MYNFELLDIKNLNTAEFEGYKNKNLFTSLRWLAFLQEWKRVTPVIIRITGTNNELVGHFTGCIMKEFGFRILGSPFYGWMGQHMGFDFVNSSVVDKAKCIDELIAFLKKEVKIAFLILADFQFSKDDIDKCKTPLFFDTERWSYFLDLTQTEEQLFKNFKSGYRTCVRKFEKMGGTIVEDMTDEFIEEHHAQLKEVFERKEMTSPNYRERMKILYHNYPDMVLSIKALDEKGNNIASSYYLMSGSMAFFASNASLTDALRYNANQALMWYAMKYFKAKGLKTLDFAGRADYKKNFGSELKGTPTIVWAKHEWQYKLVLWARNTYYNSFRIKYKIKEMLHRNKDVSETTNNEANEKDSEK